MKILIDHPLSMEGTQYGVQRYHQIFDRFDHNIEITILSQHMDPFKCKNVSEFILMIKSFIIPYSFYIKDNIKIIRRIYIPPSISKILCRLSNFYIGRVVKKENPDIYIIIAPVIEENIINDLNCKIVFDICDYTSEMVPDKLKKYALFMEDLCIKKSDLIITSASTLKDYVHSKYPHKKVIVIPNGVSNTFSNNINPAYIKSKNEIVIGFVGIFGEWIDIELLFRLSSILSDYTFLFVGPFSSNLSKYDWSKNVIFTGRVEPDKVKNYISSMDICLIPFKDNKVSNHACPLKLFEYMACGKPVIVKDTMSETRRVASNLVYYYQDLNNLIDIINKIKNVTIDLYAYKSFIKKYDWDTISKEYQQTLLQIANE